MSQQVIIWNIPKVFGIEDTAIIIGGGPSIKDLTIEEKKKINSFEGLLIAVNQSYEIFPDADVCWWGDQKWFDWNEKKRLQEFKGIILTCNTNYSKLAEYQWVKVVTRSEQIGISDKPSVVFWNACSGNSAINVAYLFGVGRIILLGFDMNYEGIDKSNFYEKNYHSFYKLKKEPIPKGGGKYLKERYNLFLSNLKIIKNQLKKRNIEIFHGTKGSKADFIESISLKEILK